MLCFLLYQISQHRVQDAAFAVVVHLAVEALRLDGQLTLGLDVVGQTFDVETKKFSPVTFFISGAMTFDIAIIVLQRLWLCVASPYHNGITKPRASPKRENRNERDKGV